MEKVTTIPEIEKIHEISKSAIVNIFNKNGIKPISTEDIYINRIRQPRMYLLSAVDHVILEYKQGKEKPVDKHKNYSHEFICRILRPHNLNSLSSKLVTSWNFTDWQQFENLKNEKLKSIQVNY